MAEQYLAEYLRLSVEDGDIASNDHKTESNSIQHQRNLISRYRKEKKLYPGVQAMEFVDDGYSGTNFERPAVKRLLSLARERKICCIIVKDFSRFGRNYLEVEDYLEQIFPFMGIRFIAINDGYDSDDYLETTGGIEIAFKNLLYDMYSKDLSIKMRSSLEVRRKRGDFVGPRPPFGYQFSEDKKKLIVDKTAAQYVQRIFELACMGHSTGKIAIKLNEEGIPTPGQYKNQKKVQYHIMDGDGYWNSKMVLKILENRVYLGTVVNAKYRVTKIGGSQFKHVPDEERICVPDRHEAIITEQIFLAATKVIKYNGQQKGKKHHYRKENALLGTLRCGNCRRSLLRITRKSISYFTCERAGYDKGCGCFNGRLKEPEVESFLLDQINEKLREERQKQSDEPQRTESIQMEEQALIREKLNALKIEKQYLYEQFKLQQIDRGTYLQRVEPLRKREIGLCERLKDLEEGRGMFRNQTEDAGRLERLTREIVERYIDRVYIHNETEFDIIFKKI